MNTCCGKCNVIMSRDERDVYACMQQQMDWLLHRFLTVKAVSSSLQRGAWLYLKKRQQAFPERDLGA